MRVIVVSSEQLFLDGLVSLLAGQAEVSFGTSARECVRAARLEKDAVVVVDLRSTNERDLDYLVGAQEFGSFSVLFISDSETPVPEGIESTLSRNSSGSELLGKILGGRNMKKARGERRTPAVAAEETVVKRRGRPVTFTNSLPLTARQYQVAELLAEGRTLNQVGEIMNVREQTVKNVLQTIYKKLGIGSRAALLERLAASR